MFDQTKKINSIATVILSAITGTTIWEGIKFISPELQKVIKDKRDSRKIIIDNIDPLLKSADELLGKIHSLAKSDFKDHDLLYQENTSDTKSEILYTLYLFCAFYARLSIIRKESSFINLGSYKKGRQFLNFMYSFESKKNRIIPKHVQRSLGDSFINDNGLKMNVYSLLKFKQEINNKNQIILESLTALELALINSKDKNCRQKILLLGILL